MADFSSMIQYIPALMTMFGAGQEKTGYDQAAQAKRVQAERTRVSTQFTVQQLEVNAGQSIAASQRQAMELRRQTKLVESRAIAVAAAGGGGASDPTIIGLISKIHGEGAYRAGVALYQGEDAARSLRMKAAAVNYEGSIAADALESQGNAYETQGTTALVKGASSLFQKYGFGNNKTGDGLTEPAGGGQTDAWAVGGYGT